MYILLPTHKAIPTTSFISPSRDTALSTQEIKDNGITHILNAAHGTNNQAYGGYVGTNPTYYAKLRNVKFFGVPAMDMPSFYIRPYLRQAADFIDKALKEGGERGW